MRILVVDKDVALGRALVIGLGAFGHEVDVVPQARPDPYCSADVVLVGAAMRGPEEVAATAEAVRELRSQYHGFIIALSDGSRRLGNEAMTALGADGWVAKPFGISELLGCIKAVTQQGALAVL
jgi:DNA-binding response OmpR family regulator